MSSNGWKLTAAQATLLSESASLSDCMESCLPRAGEHLDLVNVFTVKRARTKSVARITSDSSVKSFTVLHDKISAVARLQVVRGQEHEVIGNSRFVCTARILLADYKAGHRSQNTWKEDLDHVWIEKIVEMATEAPPADEVAYFQCGYCSTLI